MKKILISALTTIAVCGAITPASAHGWRGGHGAYGGGWHGERHYGWAPYATGAIVGAVVANAYYRSRPAYYPPQYYPMAQRTAAYCPENGLYYPQTQACPSGWQRVAY